MTTFRPSIPLSKTGHSSISLELGDDNMMLVPCLYCALLGLPGSSMLGFRNVAQGRGLLTAAVISHGDPVKVVWGPFTPVLGCLGLK